LGTAYKAVVDKGNCPRFLRAPVGRTTMTTAG
jgi:hypothetical protein